LSGEKRRGIIQTIKALITLCKPKIVLMCLIVGLSGMILASRDIQASAMQMALAMIALLLDVAAANSLNMFLERNSDKKMERTKNRPLPSEKLNPMTALIFGSILGTLSLVILFFYVNNVTFVLGIIALITYVMVYTPLKYKTPYALYIGAVPGAMPVLMGYTAVSNQIDLIGFILFSVLFFWQIPHFLSIAIVRKNEYKAAGIKAFSLYLEEKYISIQMIIFSVFMMISSLLIGYAKIAGNIYLIMSSIIGLWFIFAIIQGVKNKDYKNMGSIVYTRSIVYLPLLIASVSVDILISKYI